MKQIEEENGRGGQRSREGKRNTQNGNEDRLETQWEMFRTGDKNVQGNRRKRERIKNEA